MATLSDFTPREEEILQLVLIGRTNKAIAKQICVTEKTVEFHLGHIYTKIGPHTPASRALGTSTRDRDNN